MDEKAEELRLLGACGIVGEALRILRCRAKLLCVISFTLILPLSLATLGYNFMLFHILKILLTARVEDFSRQLTEFSAMGAGYVLLAFALWLLSTAAVAYTVACVYAAKEKPSLARAIRIVPKVWKRVVITSLCFSIIVVLMLIAYGFTLFLRIWSASQLNSVYATPLTIVLFVLCVVLLRLCVYMKIVWQVAVVVSVLEEKYCGLEAMKKSHSLIRGKRSTAWVLTIWCILIEFLYSYAAIIGYRNVEGVVQRIAYGTFISVVACVISLMAGLTQSVLYFVCKSHHREDVNESVLEEGDDGGYLPVKTTDAQPKT